MYFSKFQIEFLQKYKYYFSSFRKVFEQLAINSAFSGSWDEKLLFFVSFQCLQYFKTEFRHKMSTMSNSDFHFFSLHSWWVFVFLFPSFNNISFPKFQQYNLECGNFTFCVSVLMSLCPCYFSQVYAKVKQYSFGCWNVLCQCWKVFLLLFQCL